MGIDARDELQHILSTLATREDMRAEAERTRQHPTLLIERQTRTIQSLIDAIELMKYIDSERN
jgi:hypothetical protein